MYAGTAGTVSVKGKMDNINFSSYLRDRMNNHRKLLCYPFRTECWHPHPRQTVNNSQGVFSAPFRPPQKPASFSTPYWRHPIIYSSLNMTGEAQGYFKDHIRHPEQVYLPSSSPPATPLFHHNAPSLASSWHINNGNYDYTTGTPKLPMKIDNRPALSVPGVLPRNVDTSKYESLSYDEWSTASVDYDSSSPSASTYYTSSPATPSDAYADVWLDAPLPMNYLSYPDPSTFRCRPQSITDTTNATLTAPTSIPNFASHVMPSGLPSGNNILGNPSYEHPTYPHFNHGRIIEPNLSPPDLDAQTSSESDDDYEEASSDSPLHPRNYTFAGGDINARNRRDELLLKMRSQKYSYRDIKDICGFKEAESTLRGRYRALTKENHERVRKPQWKPHDVST